LKQFAKVQGSGLVALGILLIALRIYILFSSTRQSSSPTQAPATPTPGEQVVKFAPGIVGLIAVGFGAYLVLLQRKQRSNEETQTEKTSSGLPM
jgi:uncharacterized membrane protein